jgi:hypothetical protein
LPLPPELPAAELPAPPLLPPLPASDGPATHDGWDGHGARMHCTSTSSQCIGRGQKSHSKLLPPLPAALPLLPARPPAEPPLPLFVPVPVPVVPPPPFPDDPLDVLPLDPPFAPPEALCPALPLPPFPLVPPLSSSPQAPSTSNPLTTITAQVPRPISASAFTPNMCE